MKRLSLFLVLLLSLFVSVNAQEETPEAVTGVSPMRLDRLSRGINLSNWFWFGPETVDELRAVYDADDFNYLRDMGFKHVRIPIDLVMVYDERYEDLLNARVLPVLEESVQAIVDADLGVIIDIQSTILTDTPNSIYEGRLETEPAFVDNFVKFWGNFAGRLSKFNPDYVFFEPLNEPVFQDDPTAWWPVQERIINAIRANAPEHTVIATAAFWSGIFSLVKLEPVADTNVVYNFHFYEPFIFTHQGADWTNNIAGSARDVPYPSNPRKIEAALKLAEGNAELVSALQAYGDAQWDRQKIEDEIAWAASWAAKYNVPIICTEFGVYKAFAPQLDRTQWYEDLRVAFEEYSVGWTLWEYLGNFGIAERNGDTITHDTGVATALGLLVPREE